MSLDEISLESGDGGITSQEAPSEKSEQQRESSRRAQAQLQKVQKDEKKAKNDNEDLFRILSKFIQNPLYSEIVPDITILLKENFPSRFLLFLIALIYPEASYYLLEKTEQNQYKSYILSLTRSEEPTPFSDSIHTPLRDWVTVWLTTGEQFIIQPDASVVLLQKLSYLISHSPNSEIAVKSLAKIFAFFFTEKNIILSPDRARSYSEFILSQIRTSLDSSLLHQDNDLRETKEIQERDLFGI
ncbi:MAG: hypothetical protein HHAS10_11450 [Candidatus Altimarinota bacterium]